MALSLTVTGSLTLDVDGQNRPSGSTGSALAIAASGGTAPYTYRLVGEPPLGLGFGADGKFTGQPLGRGSSVVRVFVQDSATPPNFICEDQTLVIS